MVLTSRPRGFCSLMLRGAIPRGIFTPSTVGRRLRFTAARPARPTAAPPTITPSAPFAILPAPLPALAATPARGLALLELAGRPPALEALALVAAARDPERFSAELEAARLLRTEDAFELLRAEPAFELLRAAEFELLRAAELELLRAAEFELLRAEPEPELELRRLELAAVAPLSLAAGRLRSAVFGDALFFVLVCLAISPPLYGRSNEGHVLQHRLRPCRWSVRSDVKETASRSARTRDPARATALVAGLSPQRETPQPASVILRVSRGST